MSAQNRTFLDARERLLRLPEVRARTGMGTTTVYRRMAEGTFPRPIPIGGNRVAWIESQIDTWIAARIEAAGAARLVGAEAVAREAKVRDEPQTAVCTTEAAPAASKAVRIRKPRAAKTTAKRAGKRAAARDAETV
ncbi:AlpA family transcriptional regulator [Paraburkholderia sp. J7]|uniref:AlpA family transcriptional regulator n=1 Tax=Paraburkholderia sp. J7 TaxID=2805438 RepID=UPI002AB7DAA4|nr:AlpA family transcriptional regulator [Paraburkholderia sp. J7]